MTYVLDWLEFQVLMAARGIFAYYGFSSTDGDRTTPQEVYYAVYRMARDGMLKSQDGDLRIQPPFDRYLDIIQESPFVMLADRGGWAVPRQCVYLAGDQALCVEHSAVDRERLCITAMDEAELFRQFQDLLFLPSPVLTQEIGAFDDQEYISRSLEPGIREELTGAAKDWQEERLLAAAQVHALFTLACKETGRPIRRLALLELPMEYYMAFGAGEQANFLRYTTAAATEQIKKWWRNET